MVQIANKKTHPSSFRDPSGFLFLANNKLYRQVNVVYKEDYKHLKDSGLFDALVKDGSLIPHKEVDKKRYAFTSDAYKVLRPEVVKFISYPYEWSFSQLKDTALLILRIQEQAIRFGMILKDASAYNVQFRNCKPIFIDTLSFERYQEETPWIAYKQFLTFLYSSH